MAALARPFGQNFDNPAPRDAAGAQPNQHVIQHVRGLAGHTCVRFPGERCVQLGRFFRDFGADFRDTAVEQRARVAALGGAPRTLLDLRFQGEQKRVRRRRRVV